MSTVWLMTSLLTVDCSRFLPPQHKTLGRRLFGGVSWYGKVRWRRRTQLSCPRKTPWDI